MASDACSGSFIVQNGQVRRPGPVFIPGVVVDEVLEVPNSNPIPIQRRPSRRVQYFWNGNRYVYA